MINQVSVYKKIFINTFAQFGSKVLSILLSLISVSLLTRYLGNEGYGNYTLVFTYISFFVIISDIGFNVMVVREFSDENKKSQLIKATFLNLKIALIVISIILPLIGLFFFPYSAYLKHAIVIGIFAMAIGNMTSYATSILQSQVSLHLVALIDILSKIITVVVIICFTRLNLGFLYVIWSIFIGNFIGFMVSIYFIRTHLVFKFHIDKNLTKRLITKGLPVGITAFLSLLYFKVDTIMLSVMKSSVEVGIYALSYKLLENILMFWGLYMASIFPLLSKYYLSSEILKYRDLLNKTLLVLYGSSIVIVILGYISAPFIMRVLGGSKFFSSMVPFRILLLAVPLFLLNNIFYTIILSFGRTKYLILPLIISLMANIVLNFLVIPRYGYIGTSIVTVISELITAILYLLIIGRNFKQEKQYLNIYI